MDPTAINTTSNGQYLFSHGMYNLCSVSGYGHFTPYENNDYFVQAFTLDALHVLCSLSCTSTLHVTSYHVHFAQEKIEA